MWWFCEDVDIKHRFGEIPDDRSTDLTSADGYEVAKALYEIHLELMEFLKDR